MAWCYPLCVVLQNEIKKFCYILTKAIQRLTALTALTGFRFSIRLFECPLHTRLLSREPVSMGAFLL